MAGRIDTATEPHARQWKGNGLGFIIKLILMAAINAFGVFIIFNAWVATSWVILTVAVLLLIAANVIYFGPWAIPLKYLYPGLTFLLVFQIFTLGYTGWVALTNYGTGHAGNMQQAVDATLIQNERPLEGASSVPLTIVRDGSTVGFAVAPNDQVLVGTAEKPMEPVDGAQVDSKGKPSEVPGWEIVERGDLLRDKTLQDEVIAMRVQASDDPNDGSYRTRDGNRANVYHSTMVWDEDAMTMTNTQSGKVYHVDKSQGYFVTDDGEKLATGWSVFVGADNFIRAVTDSKLAQPLFKVLAWTFAFAIISVVVSFFVGLLFALVYNDSRVRGRKVIRTLLILPYAFPAFMSALLWRGMLNSEFGVINELFFFGSNISWLQDPNLARFAVVFVNVWLSYPYWFLVATGALQSLPADTMEAATLDGAGAFRKFRSITLPLLLVSTAPLAISSFAFAFNNFTIIFMMTEGGPMFPGDPNRLGATDILISAIYKISGVSGGVADYGLASALSIVVFVIVGVISALAFRQTRKLEEYM